ncbi:hypothetical protein [Sporosarcina limicola]|uniref:Uncharacterized protein n=1 Tax=Sporosarcina limicola TaxID=34101 RepID=A0A927MFY6_9BACL|nr:hypothetical protein [Sporosarcina limicola]MBE1553735.1 hypothetical protein [Sporosarcina limicola]
MDYVQLLNEVKMRSDGEVQTIAWHYGIDLSKKEIGELRPLLNDISFHWIFTGVPESFLDKVKYAIGHEKTAILFQKYLDSTN